MRRALALWASSLMLGGVVQAPAWALEPGTADPTEAVVSLSQSLLRLVRALQEEGAPGDAVEKLGSLSALLAEGHGPRTQGARSPGPSTQSGEARKLVTDLFGDGCDKPPAHPALKSLRVPRPPIKIRGDLDFHPGNGVLDGDGTAEDPYLIALWDIRPVPLTAQNALDLGAGILIERTNAHVRIEHVSIRLEVALTDAHPALKAANLLVAGLGAHNAGIVIRDARNVVIQAVQVNRAPVGVAFEGLLDAKMRCSVVEKTGTGVAGTIAGGRLLLDRNAIRNATRGGVELSVNAVGSASAVLRLEENVVGANGGAGLRVSASYSESSAGSLVLSRNTVEGNGLAGIGLSVDELGSASASVSIEDNVARRNGGAGVELAGALLQSSVGSFRVSRNTVESNGLDGLGLSVNGLGSASATLRVEDNVVRLNEDGIDLDASFSQDSTGNLTLSRNTVEGNVVDGLELSVDVRGNASAPLHVHGNVLRDNEASGIALLSGIGGRMSFRDNVAEGNGYGATIRGAYGNASLTLERNAIRNSTRQGVLLSASLDSGSLRFLDNVVEGNGLQFSAGGIEVRGSFGRAALQFERNVLRSNHQGLVVLGSYLGGQTIAFEGNVAEANTLTGLLVAPTNNLLPGKVRFAGNLVNRNGFGGIGATSPAGTAGAALLIEDNVVEANGWEGIAVGGELPPDSTSWVRGNTVGSNGFRAPSHVSAGGIRVWASLALGASLHVSNNLVEGNKRGVILSATRAVVDDNNILGNEVGIESVSSGGSLAQGNNIRDNQVGIRSFGDVGVPAHRNNIAGNTAWGYEQRQSLWGGGANAENNWWGSASGPGGAGPGAGDKVSEGVGFNPWLTGAV